MDKEKEIQFLLEQETMSEIVVAGYLMFLDKKGLMKEGEDFVKGFISCLTKEEFQKLVEHNRIKVETQLSNDANRGTTSK